MDTLLSLEQVSSPHNLPALRRMYDQVESNKRGLHSLGVEAETYGALLLPLLTKKLPAELRFAVSRKVAEEEWTLEKVKTAFEDELQARERAIEPMRESSRRPGRDPPTASSLVTGNAGLPTCCYCHQGHASHRC